MLAVKYLQSQSVNVSIVNVDVLFAVVYLTAAIVQVTLCCIDPLYHYNNEIVVCVCVSFDKSAIMASRIGRGSRRNIAMPFGMEKLEWLGYPMVKKF